MKYNKRTRETVSAKLFSFFTVMAAAIFLFSACNDESTIPDRPNVIIIYADDIGFGDVGVYGSELIPTPHMDEMARTGMKMTSSYATSSTCTPSRYSILTGEYAFRNERAQILDGDAPLLIDPDEFNMVKMFQENGYRTSIIGKWHLGLGEGEIDWNTAIKPGPLEVGFDESFIIPTTTDRVPTVYVEGHHVVNLDPDDPLYVNYDENFEGEPTGESHPELLRYLADDQHSGSILDGVSRIGFQKGGASAMWDDEEMSMELVGLAEEFISENIDNPFFLFFPLHQNHVPRMPNEKFWGSSETGLRGDHTVEFDWSVGEIVRILEEQGLRENTLIIISSDNGPIYDDGYDDGAIEDANGHVANGIYRGGKYTAFEGATRLPFIVNWPGVVEPGIVSDAKFSQVDLMASFASLLGVELSDDTGIDSLDLLEVMLGRSFEGRPHILQQGAGTDHMGLRVGDWKLIPNPRVPGWVNPKHNERENPISTPMPTRDTIYLFNLADDPGETTNLADQHPEIVEELMELYERILNENDIAILNGR